jgi:VanZ family protein
VAPPGKPGGKWRKQTSTLFLKTARQRRLSSYMIPAILGMGISLAIELSQAYLPTRDSSLTDVVLNSAGTILGVVIFQIFTQNPKSHRIGGELRRLI